MEITIRDEFIKLGQALKLAGVVEDGVQAKYEIQDGNVKVNGEVDQRRGRLILTKVQIFFTEIMHREKPISWNLSISVERQSPTRAARIKN